MARRHRCLILVLVAALAGAALGENATLVVAGNAKQVRRMLKSQHARRDAEAAAAADVLAGDDALRRSQFPLGTEGLDDENRVTYRRKGLPDGETTLLSYRLTAAGIGAAKLAGQDRKNLGKLYEDLYSILPAKRREGLGAPSKVRKKKLSAMRADFARLLGVVTGDFELIRLEISTTVLDALQTNFIADCSQETGYETAGLSGEVSARCAVSEYAANGIMRNVDFALKDHLTCVKDQGRRGTCWAHAIAAAVETQVLVNGGAAENLSEQSITFRALVTSNWDERYDDGELPSHALNAFVADGYRVPYESAWNYNRSLSRSTTRDAVTHGWPDSCLSQYLGEMCTDFSFQAEELAELPPGAGLPVSIRYHYPAAPPAQGHVVTGWTQIPDLGPLPGFVGYTLDMMTLLVESGRPVIMSFGCPQSVFSPDADGYVRHVQGQASIGGHAVLVVGFVDNAHLPSGVTADPSGRGYYVIKNSWGTGWADCGFGYLSADFVDRWGYEFVYIDDRLN